MRAVGQGTVSENSQEIALVNRVVHGRALVHYLYKHQILQIDNSKSLNFLKMALLQRHQFARNIEKISFLTFPGTLKFEHAPRAES